MFVYLPAGVLVGAFWWFWGILAGLDCVLSLLRYTFCLAIICLRVGGVSLGLGRTVSAMVVWGFGL